MRWPWSKDEPKEKSKNLSPEDIKVIISQAKESVVADQVILADNLTKEVLHKLNYGQFQMTEEGLLVEVESESAITSRVQNLVKLHLNSSAYSVEVDTYGYHKLRIYFK